MATSSASLPDLPNKKGKTNWVEQAGGLPKYIERIAKHLHSEQGFTVSRAIATAVNTVKRWAAGGTVRENGGATVTAKTRAQAAKALAEWEAKRKAGKVREAAMEPGDLAAARAWAKSRLALCEGLLAGDLKAHSPMQDALVRQLGEGWVGAEPWVLRLELERRVQDARLIEAATADLPESVGEDAVDAEIDESLLVGPGAEGEQVAQLQERLAELGAPVNTTGKYDAATARMVAEVQKAAGLEATGEVDAATVDALRRAAAPSPQDEAPAPEEVKESADPMAAVLREAREARLRARNGTEWTRARAREVAARRILEARR